MGDGRHHTQTFGSRQALAEMLADAIAGRLAAAIEERGRASLAVSGGTTPALLFASLSQKPIAWERVDVTLVDERFVPPDSPRSNEALVRRTLLTGPAAAAIFVPLYREAGSVAQALDQSELALSGIAWPLDVAVLGMGADGHTASFFPDAAELGDLLDPGNDGILRSVTAPSAGEPRLTMTLARLAAARFLALHIEGEEKRSVLDRALSGQTHPPIAAVLASAERPVEIFWAP